jgi:prepilin-type N-terminal cleavage/methylation domain-containing protein
MYPRNCKPNTPAGVTLIELLVAMALSSIIIIALFRILTDTLWTYNSQEQQTAINEDAKYAMRRMTDLLMEAGANLPASRFAVITVIDSANIYLRANPRGGMHVFEKDSAGINGLPLSDASRFEKAAYLVKVSLINLAAADTNIRIDHVAKKSNSSYPDTLFLKSGPFNFKKFDAIYACTTFHYYRNITDLCLNNDNTVIAGNLDSLSIQFLDSANSTIQTLWKDMRFARLAITTKSTMSNPSTHQPYKVPLIMNFRLKNKT